MERVTSRFALAVVALSLSGAPAGTGDREWTAGAGPNATRPNTIKTETATQTVATALARIPLLASSRRRRPHGAAEHLRPASGFNLSVERRPVADFPTA